MFFKKEVEGYLGREWNAEELSMVVVDMGGYDRIRFVKLSDDNTAQFVAAEYENHVPIERGCGFEKVNQMKVTSVSLLYPFPYGPTSPIWSRRDIKSVVDVVEHYGNDLRHRRLDPLAITGQKLQELEQYATKKIWDRMDEYERATGVTPFEYPEYDNGQLDDVRYERVEENIIENL